VESCECNNNKRCLAGRGGIKQELKEDLRFAVSRFHSKILSQNKTKQSPVFPKHSSQNRAIRGKPEI
jgi:hypothetical protein